ncbi:riboflavin synthase [Xenorhabdus bovienii]|uniref:Riboflavin synthase n=2 Tax=Xenorhabdus bovienii TaxID=40576 RepID=A0A077PCG3_XENBV|nr:riboflavin synthase [Xenorhabdus bovienii]MDE9447427.1 riboflavin synthase [Xenorhabdus bovienii]MDE9483019.1 riboflavin synthase [Xenorhabdus bovienii]MDE9557232.1 riboflavin synthase [Xenorhabdus bovienii]CDH18723.1 Riboflavin synthase subunit alpha [Xenorhabdus bovienii str. kraussei Quebec]CDH34840.1 Riboflavin synthase subunit alpha [Xenorhabdus bovienii str. Intermedium]
MYTGIVQGKESVLSLNKNNGFSTLTVSNQNCFFAGVSVGASVAIDGTCLTVTEFTDDQVSFDISDFTADSTTLKLLTVGDEVNVERSHQMNQENGGHSLYGHVEGVAEVIEFTPTGETYRLVIRIPQDNIKYFFLKGFIGLHGCSLTINGIDEENKTVALNLIPETLRMTNFNKIKAGDFLNYEIDQMTRTIVDTLSRTLLKK